MTQAAGTTARAKEQPRAPDGAALIVIDTNLALDLLVFEDPAARPLRVALQAQAVRWLATDAMRAELMRVLGYPHIVRRLAPERLTAEGVLEDYDACSHRVPAALVPDCPRCDDPDDQPFVDLAVAHGAVLLSKDRAILGLSRRLLALDVNVASQWTPALHL